MSRLALALTAILAQPNQAIAAEEKMSSSAQQTPDFLFGRPGRSIGIRGQWLLARTNSGIFEFTTSELTLKKSDFNAPGIGVDVSFALGSRLDALLGVDFTRAFAFSEYRDFTDANGLPIAQQTTLKQLDLAGSIEFALRPRGRKIGQFAWIPSVVTPYVAAGGGLLWYRFEQEGDFVDFLDLSIFTELLESSGWTPSAHVSGGADIKLTRQLFLTTEARYVWARTELKRDFLGFDHIDLAGLRVTAGVQFLF